MLSLLLTGCLHKVRVESDPPGAVVVYAGKRKGVTPVEFMAVSSPHLRKDTRRKRLRVTLPGHRAVVTDMGPYLRSRRVIRHPLLARPLMCLLPPYNDIRGGVCLSPRTALTYVLIKEHGPAGTWSPEDVE
jgi:hypothetical protein